jgi:hypothetical protein
MSQCRLAQSRRAVKEQVVQRFTALAGRLDRNGQLFFDVGLADAFGQRPRPQCVVELLFGLAF